MDNSKKSTQNSSPKKQFKKRAKSSQKTASNSKSKKKAEMWDMMQIDWSYIDGPVKFD